MAWRLRVGSVWARFETVKVAQRTAFVPIAHELYSSLRVRRCADVAGAASPARVSCNWCSGGGSRFRSTCRHVD
jgi:hypothetical protein